MSAPEQANSGANPENGPAVEFESTGLWPIDDPEQTSHIQRPPTTPPPPASPAPAEPSAPGSFATPSTPTPPPAPAPAAADPAPRVDPEATSVVPRPTGDYTRPWAATPPASAPTSPAPGPGFAGYPPPHEPAGGYHQQYGGSPQGAAYQPAPGYPPGPSGYPAGYSPSTGYPQPQSPATESTTNTFAFTATKARPQRRRTAILIGAGVVVLVIAAVGITGFWKPGFFVTRQLNVSKVQEGVQHILTDPQAGYGISGVSNVICNGGQNPSGDEGTRFTCDLIVAGGAKHHVDVVVVDDHGTYQVGKVA
ncbi:DUF4333 domain-containing protein [Mycolicibacterium sp. CBMA 226]|uniref:DUF4333 domain-containing protein n=1 Tax=Mycolicibacterium sp. CBMA 226 TaxID=2606611 RepID=UPI0012DD1EF7|nr:DUF4333 domain-containing protein [Mycolicibacterium sp. CBMA 226]MUL78892.1 DUF4333 domain-containing protein [Mycolicibacterium sp. CBMA 226]QGW61191.1 hypothetical protein ICEMyc226_00159 [Mycolicibacterium sp.]